MGNILPKHCSLFEIERLQTNTKIHRSHRQKLYPPPDGDDNKQSNHIVTRIILQGLNWNENNDNPAGKSLI